MTKPLQWKVYLVIFVIMIVIRIIFRFAECYGNTQYHINSRICLLNHSGVIDNDDHVVRAFMKQGTSKSPETASGRVLMSSWWLIMMIVTSVYCANLVASFSAQRDIRPFSSLEELLDTDYDVGITNDGITHTIFEKSARAAYRELSKVLHQDPKLHQLDISEHIKKAKQEKYAFIGYRTDAEMLMADDCDLDILEENLTWEHLAFAVAKHSPLKHDIERVMSSLKVSGILDVLWRKWYKSRNSTMCASERKVTPISLETLTEGGIIVCVGICLAFITLAWETLKYYNSFTKVHIYGDAWPN